MDLEHWEIQDDTGTVIVGDREKIVDDWHAIKNGTMPLRFVGDVKLVKIISVHRQKDAT